MIEQPTNKCPCCPSAWPCHVHGRSEDFAMAARLFTTPQQLNQAMGEGIEHAKRVFRGEELAARLTFLDSYSDPAHAIVVFRDVLLELISDKYPKRPT